MEEEDWWKAQEAEPNSVPLLAAFSDWLQERGDPRWEAVSLLVEHGKVGVSWHGGVPTYFSQPGTMSRRPAGTHEIPSSWLRRRTASRRELLRRWVALGPKRRAFTLDHLERWWVKEEVDSM